MKKLTKKQQVRHEELSAKLTTAKEGLSAAILDFNEGVQKLHADMAPKVEAVNVAISEANTFAQEIHDEQESYYDAKSDNWRDGDAGSAYSDWMGAWELELEEVELEEPVDFDEPEIDTDSFEQLETEVSS